MIRTGIFRARREKLLALGLRIILGGIFLYASIDKLRHPADFARVIYNYQLIPDILINPIAVILPWVELLIGILLIAGIWMGGSLFLYTLLMTVFWGTMAFNLARGLNVECGCFSVTAGEPTTYLGLVRDSLILAASAYLLWKYLRKEYGARA